MSVVKVLMDILNQQHKDIEFINNFLIEKYPEYLEKLKEYRMEDKE